MYPPAEYDLARFVLVAVETNRFIDATKSASGDLVLGLPRSG